MVCAKVGIGRKVGAQKTMYPCLSLPIFNKTALKKIIDSSR
jgi:hypothetical protein